MKRFIKVTLAMLVIIASTCVFLYSLDKPSKLAKKMTGINKQLDIINLGNSHGDNFDYSVRNLNGMNINREGNTIYYDLQNYTYLYENGFLSDSATIIIPVSYFSFGASENRLDRNDDSFVNPYYNYLPKKSIYSYSFKKNVNVIFFTIQHNFRSLFTNEGSVKQKKSNVSEIDLIDYSIKRVHGHKLLSNYRPIDQNIKYLMDLINTVIANGHRPVLVTTPYHQSYNERFGSTWLNTNYYSHMNQLSSELNIKYLDYGHYKKISENPIYFYNSDHLNSHGKKVFSALIFDEILTEP